MKIFSFLHNQKGVTLVEVLIVTIIGVIAFMALAVPFLSERRFSGLGKSQVEAQRDAQLVTRAIARIARESNSFTPSGVAGNSGATFTRATGAAVCFEGGLNFNGQLLRRSGCGNTAGEIILIDGVRSRVTNFTAIEVVNDKLVDISLNVIYQNQRSETLQTRIYLRNG